MFDSGGPGFPLGRVSRRSLLAATGALLLSRRLGEAAAGSVYDHRFGRLPNQSGWGAHWFSPHFDRTFDVAETSRGCPLPCTFCSIRRMYGRTFRKFPIPRVIADLRALDARGVRGVFFVDDNVTIDVPRFKELCDEIARAGLSHLRYIVQASVHGIAKDPGLAPRMAAAGFDTVEATASSWCFEFGWVEY